MEELTITEPQARQLPTMEVNGQLYFVDSRLRELRNVNDPQDRIVFDR